MKPFKPLKKPAPGEWYLVKLDVAIEVERPGYDADKNEMVKKWVRETRIVQWRSMVAADKTPGDVAIADFRAGGERYFLSRGLTAKLTAETPTVVSVERWSDYEDRLERERANAAAATHTRAWPSNRS